MRIQSGGGRGGDGDRHQRPRFFRRASAVYPPSTRSSHAAPLNARPRRASAKTGGKTDAKLGTLLLPMKTTFNVFLILFAGVWLTPSAFSYFLGAGLTLVHLDSR